MAITYKDRDVSSMFRLVIIATGFVIKVHSFRRPISLLSRYIRNIQFYNFSKMIRVCRESFFFNMCIEICLICSASNNNYVGLNIFISFDCSFIAIWCQNSCLKVIVLSSLLTKYVNDGSYKQIFLSNSSTIPKTRYSVALLRLTNEVLSFCLLNEGLNSVSIRQGDKT